MKKLLSLMLGLLSLTLPMSAAVDGKFKYTYPDEENLPYNLGYQYSVYDLGESDIEGWRVMKLNAPLTLAYNITSEEERTVEVVFDPSYMEIVDVVIPDKVIDPDTKTEYTVTAIGKMAFDDCPEIRSVIMGDSITRIEDYAFNMCENKVLHQIGYVKFSKNLTHIGNYAFKNCHNLTTGHFTEGDQWPLTVADFVRNVDYPFYGYGGRQSGLENYLLLPASVEYIGKHAFEGCYFVKIEHEEASREYGLSKVKIPNPSCVIDDYAFAGCEFLELITIGEELTANGLTNATLVPEKRGRIGDYAFANCNLMRLDIPASIESIGENAFSNCFHKSRDHTPRINTGRIYLDNLKWFYPRSLFDNYDSWWAHWNSNTFSEVVDKNAVDKTNKYLDKWHTNTITIHSWQTSIGLNAFANNPMLEKVIINGEAGEIADAVFKNCGKLNEVTLPDDLAKLSSSMFMNCSVLDSVKIPDKVTEIGDSAFYLCKKLETIELPSELKAVNPCAFYGCEMLNISELPGKVESIGNYAFYGCKNITSISIPDKVTTIGEYAFAACYRHETKLNPDYVKGFNEPYILLLGLTQVKIGDGVQTIGAHAFDGCRHLGQIEFGQAVETIGDYAFMNCMSCPEEDHRGEGNTYQPSEVILPNTLTALGTAAFQGCSHLPEISLSKGITVIPDFAFAYCSSLSSVANYSEGISTSETAFLGCYSLENFDDFLTDVENLENGIIYNEDGTEVISALPNITSAKIKEGVTTIRDGAFADCGALTTVEFPSTLKVIGPRAFANCCALDSLKSRSELEGAVFPTALEEIGSRAFENCVSLSYAVLINVTMGELVYAGCTGIERVEIYPDFMQDLQDNWFAGCINMVGIEVIGENEKYTSDDYGQLLLDKEGTTLLRAPSGIDYLEFPESVTKIGDYSCSNCINLSEVEIPPTVKHIGAHAFDGCYLEEVDNNGNITNTGGLRVVCLINPAVTIGEYAFNNCKLLSYVEWSGDAEPGDMGSIGAFAFNNCEKLIFAAEDLTCAVIDSLKPYAFANFPGIMKIELPETLESIGDHAFDNCQNLTSVIFPESLKSIGNSAFKSSGLTYIDLPNTIEEIGDSAFMNCSKVMALKLSSSLKKINPYTFYKCFSGAEFDDDPEESVENFNLRVEIPESVESIGDYAFYGCAVNSNKYNRNKTTYSNIYHYYFYGLQSVTIGENVKTIGAHAFDGCYHLVDVEMGNAVTLIGDYAFNDCFKQRFNGVREVEVLLYGNYEKELNKCDVVWQLKDYTPQSITLPENLSSLGVGAFSGCAELPSINFPTSLTAIPDQAFNGCKLFTEIKLPEGINSIGDKAFGGCIGVKEIHVPASLEKGSRTFVDCDSALTVYYYAEVPKTFDEAFFSPKVYSSKQAVLNTPKAEIMDVKMLPPWALFHTIVAADETLVHTEDVLEAKNNLRFRVLSNKPNPYCEVARPDFEHTEDETFDIPEYVLNEDPGSPYYGESYKVIRIGNDAFEDNLYLTGITIPETVIEIGQEAFNGCKNLLEIDLPESITNMGERAFANCYGLTYFEVPPLVTRLNPEVLKDCRGLYSIKMHANIEELGMGALMDCRHLRRFEDSENWNLKLIDDYALKNCIELEDVNIPESVEKIGKEAMYYCQKLKTVSLPTTLKELGEKTFDDCEELTKIKVYTEIPPKMIGERHLTDQNCKIYVQAKNVDDYKTLWTVHEHRIEPGIFVTQPSEKEMPEYIPGATYKLSSIMPLEGQTMTWSTFNSVVAAPDGAHNGTINIQAVGPTHIKVETDQQFYHECDLDVYPQLADANWDGKFDISDAVNIANYAVLNQSVLDNWWKTGRTDFNDKDEWNRFYYRGADVNKDGSISFADASATVKVVLAHNTSSSAENRVKALAANNRDLDALVVYPSADRFIGVGLDACREYVALQANIRVPEGMKLVDVTVGEGADGHALSSRRIDDRTMRVILFDLNNSVFAANSEPLLRLEVSEGVIADDIEIFDIIASDISSTSHVLTSRTGLGLTGLSGVTVSGSSISITPEGVVVADAKGKSLAIYTTDGRLVKAFTVGSESETISLATGLYIISIDGESTKIAVK